MKLKVVYFLLSAATASAGRGIGRALVKELANSGGEVFALSRTNETLDSLSKESDRIYPIVADVSDWNNLREILQNLNVLDGVVNNAAYQLGTGPVTAMDCPKERFEKAYSTNTLAAINIIQMAGKKMIETGKRGSIVNVSSAQGLLPANGMGFYTVSKAALDMVTKQFALELGPHQIRVNSVNPGFVPTTYGVQQMTGHHEAASAIKALTPLGRLLSEMDCVYPIMYLLSEQSSMVTGGIHVIDDGWLSRLPF